MAIGTMMNQLTRAWGWIVLRGIIAILFGVLSFAWPGLTLSILVLVFGAYALSDGVLALMAGIKIKDGGKPMWSLILVGLIGIIAGVLTFAWPQMTALVLLAFIATWALVTGLLELIMAVQLRKWIPNEWMLALAGLASIAFGVLMLLRPEAGALAVIWIIASYATLIGVVLVTLGFRMKGLTDRLKPA